MSHWYYRNGRLSAYGLCGPLLAVSAQAVDRCVSVGRALNALNNVRPWSDLYRQVYLSSLRNVTIVDTSGDATPCE